MIADVVRGYAAATYESALAASRAEELGAEIEAFSAALVANEALRDALVDPNVAPVVRRSVVAELLTGRVSPETIGLIGFAVRVEPPAQLPLSIAELSALSAWSPSLAEPTSTLQSSRERLRGYVERVLEELPSTGAVDEMEDTLYRLARIIESSAELRGVLSDQNASLTARLAILDELLADQTDPQTMRVVAYTLRSGRLRNLVGTFDWIVELCAEERGRRVAEVRSAVELDDAERSRIAAALGRLTNRTVEVRVQLDPSVIGGVLIAVGDLIIDGTVRLRVERLRDALAETA